MDYQDKQEFEQQLREEQKDWVSVCWDTNRVMLLVSDKIVEIAERMALFFGDTSPAVNQLLDFAGTLDRQRRVFEKAVTQKGADDLQEARKQASLILKTCLDILPHVSEQEKASVSSILGKP